MTKQNSKWAKQTEVPKAKFGQSVFNVEIIDLNRCSSWAGTKPEKALLKAIWIKRFRDKGILSVLCCLPSHNFDWAIFRPLSHYDYKQDTYRSSRKNYEKEN